MLSDDELVRMLRTGDPHPDPSDLDPNSPAADRILAQVRQRTLRRRRRTMVVVPVVAVALAGGTAATYAWVAGDGEGHTLDSSGLNCVGSDQSDASINFNPVADDPIKVCRQLWQEAFGEPAPETLTACVDSSEQGSIEVYPGGRDECARHRSDPYRGPTREQLNLAHFRTEIRERFADRNCVGYTEFRNVISKLLAEHDLTEWSAGHFQTADKEPEGPCAEIVYYDEPEQKIWLGDGKAGNPVNLP
ncbi:hypothetical protein [Streptomyces sp. GESEQ-35]|uniref:hypothetical protein n=1 Tax=Streptomyces sp. GESEQ-35 TaxID=2812657 RepID=UPI001B32F152|nr:hypothetical protein [Streptomyces sp. GESEQ-35]